MSNAKRRHRMRRRFERRFDLALKREMGWHNDRKANWNRLVAKAGLLLDLVNDPGLRRKLEQLLDEARS